jgi:hypothetical protein
MDWRLLRSAVVAQATLVDAGALADAGALTHSVVLPRPSASLSPPSIDLFSSVHPHQVPRFFTAYWNGRCKGVDAFAADWGSLVPRSARFV